LSTAYMGTLETGDPLYSYIVRDVMPVVEREARDPVFHVSRLSGSNIVYRYYEERTRLSLIGKFYSFREPHKAERLMNEFRNLKEARALGLTELPNYVVRPLASEKRMGLGLLEEYVEGKDLDYYIRRAVHDGRHYRLRERLTDLAFFLAELHKRTSLDDRLDIAPAGDYYDKLLRKLAKKGLLDERSVKAFRRLKEEWLEREYMREDREVVIHGDATPTNFLFPPESGVVAIDLERMKRGDRMFDVGMVCGELKHAFMWRVGDKFAAEPHIGHFLSEYAKHFGEDAGVYDSVTRRNPFYMAVTELRIARNNWLDREHRGRLVKEARECLEWGLKLK
jgi:aminoglycoside phosphotransferase (APT) family kinase protein